MEGALSTGAEQHRRGEKVFVSSFETSFRGITEKREKYRHLYFACHQQFFFERHPPQPFHPLHSDHDRNLLNDSGLSQARYARTPGIPVPCE
jgi:hypothetical protein